MGPAVLELFRSMPEEADSNRLLLACDIDDGGAGGAGGGLRAYRDMLRGSAHVVLGLCEGAVGGGKDDDDDDGRR